MQIHLIRLLVTRSLEQSMQCWLAALSNNPGDRDTVCAPGKDKHIPSKAGQNIGKASEQFFVCRFRKRRRGPTAFEGCLGSPAKS